MNAGRASCFTFTSPQYINWMRSLRAEWLTSFRKTARREEKGEKIVSIALRRLPAKSQILPQHYLLNACWLAGIWVNIFRK